MSTHIAEVQEDDFSRIGGEKPPHLKIEATLIELGGNGVRGTDFKLRALKAAGWKYGKMMPYGSYPKVAAEAFNKIRRALSASKDQEQLLQALQSS
ncbi:MAG: hypothetical protein KKA36_01660 [Gammaproteobacteria bacterium]|nr:hypothetical protein [Gammaproteobacteria bacterium]MBU2477768.1 hypothetical protein [Gammaproteobacteria bacterium]